MDPNRHHHRDSLEELLARAEAGTGLDGEARDDAESLNEEADNETPKNADFIGNDERGESTDETGKNRKNRRKKRRHGTPADEMGENSAAPGDAAAPDAPKDSALGKEKKARRKDARDFDDFDEDTMPEFNLRSILGADFLGTRTLRNNFLYLLIVVFMLIVYVSNRYAYQRAVLRGETLAGELDDRRFKALTVSSELTEYTMRSRVEANLPDTTLRTAERPAFYLPVNPDEPSDDDDDEF